MLSSVLFARCPDASPALSFMSLIRRLSLSAKIKGVDYNIWATLQKPKEVKARNRRLMKFAAYLNDFLCVDVPQTETWKCVCVCWSSGTLILSDTRVCRGTS